MSRLESLLRKHSIQHTARADFEAEARAILSEAVSPFQSALDAFNQHRSSIPTLNSAGEDSVRQWFEVITNERTRAEGELSRKFLGDNLDTLVYSVLTYYNYRHLKGGEAYTAAEVASNDLIKRLGIDETYITDFIKRKMKEVADVKYDNVVYYGVRVKRDFEFVKNRSKVFRDKDKVYAQDFDVINEPQVRRVLGGHYRELGLQRKMVKKRWEYYWRTKKETSDFSYTTEDIIRGTSLDANKVRYVRGKLRGSKKLVIGDNMILKSGKYWRYNEEGSNILTRGLRKTYPKEFRNP
jgi:hypothetical protein